MTVGPPTSYAYVPCAAAVAQQRMVAVPVAQTLHLSHREQLGTSKKPCHRASTMNVQQPRYAGTGSSNCT